VTEGDHNTGHERTAWFFRPVILFATAYIIIIVIHEGTHAVFAYALNVPFTLYPFAVNLARDRGTITDRAIIGVAGPLCAFVVGLICWFLYRRARGSRQELLLLYLTTFGVATLFGNLISVGLVGEFVGDFSRAASALRLSTPSRYAASLLGLLSLCVLMFAAGWALRRLSPAGSSRLRAMLGMVLLPAVVGTAIATLASLPMPTPLLLARLMEPAFWIFGVVGLLMSRGVPTGDVRTLQVRWTDALALAAMVIVLRVMAIGISMQQ
jgi:hypothetical protein